MWNTKHKKFFGFKNYMTKNLMVFRKNLWPKTKSTHYAKRTMQIQCMTLLNWAIEGTQTRNINFLINPWVHVQTSTHSYKIKNSLALITHTIQVSPQCQACSKSREIS